MSDLVRRIEAHTRRTPYRSGVEDLLAEAADAIERLERERDEARAEIERLRRACATGWGEPMLVETLKRERDEAVRLGQLHWEDWDRAEKELEAMRKERSHLIDANDAERERAEAHAEIERLRAEVQSYKECCERRRSLADDYKDVQIAVMNALPPDVSGPKLAPFVARIIEERDQLRAALAEAQKERDEAHARVADYHRSLTELSALWHATANERDEARGVLREMEWGKPHIGYYDARGQERWSPTCRLCHKMRDDGHAPGCRLDAFLAGMKS